MDTINDFDVIKVNMRLAKGHLSLSSWLIEPSRWNTGAISSSPTISGLAVGTIGITPSLASDCTRPNKIVIIIVHGDDNFILVFVIKLEITIGRCWILKEALTNITGLHTR